MSELTDETRCWLCRRTSQEVSAALDRQTEKENEIDRMIARVEDSSRQFERAARLWTGGSVEQFKTMDFNFVLGNPGQFKAMKFLSDVARAKKSLADPLVEGAHHAKVGKDVNLGIVSIPGSDRAQLDLMTKKLADFDLSSGRRLFTEEPSPDKPAVPEGYDGLKLKDGIRFLTDVGLLYYATQKDLLLKQKEAERGKRPGYKIEVVKVKGYPAGVPLCSVCELLIK